MKTKKKETSKEAEANKREDIVSLDKIGFYTLSDLRAKNVTKNSDLERCELLLTDRCNFDCPYCRTDKQSGYEITLEEAKHIVDIGAKDSLKNIRFSGGECTIWRGLTELVSYAKSKGIKRIAISTNGSAKQKLYKKLVECGVNDFSISLDACCASTSSIMSGRDKNMHGTIINNIKYLSSVTYVTVGVVLTETNMKDLNNIIKYAHLLGVSDIRIIPAAQYKSQFKKVFLLADKILIKHPILYYRICNAIKGRPVRGINNTDCNKCPLVLDDMVIRGNKHYPCIIKLREGCEPIGYIDGDVREDRYKYYLNSNTHEDSICSKNCLDVCVDYNNKAERGSIKPLQRT